MFVSSVQGGVTQQNDVLVTPTLILHDDEIQPSHRTNITRRLSRLD
jgi:hypothetical protein